MNDNGYSSNRIIGSLNMNDDSENAAIEAKLVCTAIGENNNSQDLQNSAGANEDLIIDPLLQYLNIQHASKVNLHFNLNDAIQALQTQGYYHIPSVLTSRECEEALHQLWEFVQDVSGGFVDKNDPTSWYCSGDLITHNGDSNNSNNGNTRTKNNNNDLDPWPHSGHSGSITSTCSSDMFQSLGAGQVLGNVREQLARRIFEPLFGTNELICSKEGFVFHRPLIVDLTRKQNGDEHDDSAEEEVMVEVSDNTLIWRNPYPKVNMSLVNDKRADTRESTSSLGGNTIGRKINTETKSKSIKHKCNKHQKNKDMSGLCHIQASISFTDQTIDKDRGGGHFLCYPRLNSNVQSSLLGGQAGEGKECASPTQKLSESGYHEQKIYANIGDVILWRSDLLHTEVAPSLEEHNKSTTKYNGAREFRAVGYCSMLPAQAVKDYTFYSIPKHKLSDKKNICKEEGNVLQMQSRSPTLKPTPRTYSSPSSRALKILQLQEEELARQKLEAYRTGRTGDYRPHMEVWYGHHRTTLWNRHASSHQQSDGSSSGASSSSFFDNDFIPQHIKCVPPRIFQQPCNRLGAPELTLRQAELYGLVPYRKPLKDGNLDEIQRRNDIERAVIRGVHFMEGVYNGKNADGIEIEPLKMQDRIKKIENRSLAPICLSSMEVLTPSVPISGQDKYLGGMASPCGTMYIYGVPGHAKRVIRVTVETGEIDWIGPEYKGDFKWLRGVEVPPSVMGKNADGSLAYPSGCCLALPCNSNAGCVLKINPDTSAVSTFITGPPIPDVEEGWLYHGGNLSSFDGFVYAIPASAPRVMKIDPVKETTEYIGPEFPGKAKWYGGITGADGCIYGIAHNSSGVLKINPQTQEVTILAEGALPEGRWKWHGGLASLDRKKIIGFPNNADSILVVDVMKSTVYTVGDSTILRSGSHRVPQDGRYKYLGGSLTADGRYAYLFPCDAEYVLRMDMVTDELKIVGPHLTEGENKFQNGFVAQDGCVYGIPQRSSGVLRIVPPGIKRWDRNGHPLPDDEEHVDVIYCGDDMVSCKDKFEGGVLGMDGCIYCIPLRAKAFVKIIPGPAIEGCEVVRDDN